MENIPRNDNINRCENIKTFILVIGIIIWVLMLIALLVVTFWIYEGIDVLNLNIAAKSATAVLICHAAFGWIPIWVVNAILGAIIEHWNNTYIVSCHAYSKLTSDGSSYKPEGNYENMNKA